MRAIWVIRRLLTLIPTLFLVSALTFFLMRLAPGGPFDTDKAWPPEVKQNIEKRYGLSDPLTTQFASWLKDMSHGDLRESFHYVGRPVVEILKESAPISFELGLVALAISILIGIPLGMLAAIRPRSWFDFSASLIAIAGVSLPAYLAAALLVLVFANILGWLPPALVEGPSSYILPVITLALRPLAVLARLARAQLLETLSSDYIRTAHAKGMPLFRVLYKHALKNAAIPLLSVLGPLTANILTGSFLVETVFQIPGVGKYFVQAVISRDYPLVSGVTLLYASTLLFSNFIVDFIANELDPRLQEEENFG